MAKVLMKGNEAVAEAAVRGGCRFFAGYPITPQSEIPEYLSGRLPEVGGVFVQGESEVASINMVYGAAVAGVRAMTGSSGPGISLKAEGISYLSGALLPAVIVNVSRGGPGLGSIQPAQQDYLQATKALGHGGFRLIVEAPHTVQEAVDLVYDSFELAERDRNPVFILMDGCLGAVMEEVELPPMKELPERPDWALGNFEKGEHEPRIITSIPGEDVLEMLNKRAAMLQQSWAVNDVRWEEYRLDDAEYVCVAYGTSARVCKYAINELRKEGIKVGLIRPITLYPFPNKVFHDLDYSRVKAIIDVEMAIPCQMVEDIAAQVMERAPILQYGHSGGNTINNEDTTAAIKALIGGLNK
ncbi:MAG TPA: 3-methyl-2-oxobutanoate dehydrogenase subunit VorB [Candidatus Scatomorpha merdigallinarum]|nr:3-methyl-2-oxobutanoate dehydrogenase subunit VorB [Candidatus Scatomorpha merdigallinarum]